ncbi:MAG: DNA-binding protein [Phycisphaerales bacterium]|nr:MAG: DNA-binding protein [Phycisphaerales bacterium]
MTTRPPVPIAVFGRYGAVRGDPVYAQACEIGAALASAGFAVATGGYAGVMEAAGAGARSAGGTSIGVTCSALLERDDRRRPNDFLDHRVDAPDLLTRIRLLLTGCGGYVVLPGGTGTLAELALALEFVSKRFIAPRPVVLAGDWFRPVLELIAPDSPSPLDFVHVESSPQRIAAVMFAGAATPEVALVGARC